MKVTEIVLSGGMVGTTEVEERQDLYRFTLRRKKDEKRDVRQVDEVQNSHPVTS